MIYFSVATQFPGTVNPEQYSRLGQGKLGKGYEEELQFMAPLVGHESGNEREELRKEQRNPKNYVTCIPNCIALSWSWCCFLGVLFWWLRQFSTFHSDLLLGTERASLLVELSNDRKGRETNRFNEDRFPGRLLIKNGSEINDPNQNLHLFLFFNNHRRRRRPYHLSISIPIELERVFDSRLLIVSNTLT